MHSVCSVFRHNHTGAGPHPELCTLFFRLAALLAIPTHAVFVFDGPRRPPVKRGKRNWGKSHWLALGFQSLLDAFGFRWYEVRTWPSVARDNFGLTCLPGPQQG
jgi:hypothetical protein